MGINVKLPGISNQLQAILVFATFLLIAINGYLLQSSFVIAHPYLLIFTALLPGIIMIVKEVAGSSQPGILSPTEQALLMFVALVLTGIGGAISSVTTDPTYLFIGGLLGAFVAAIKEYLGSAPKPATPLVPQL